MPPKTNQPSDLELQVLSVLWENGPATVRDILAALPDGKTRAYTTVLTVMQNLERKGLVTKTREGSAHVFQTTESQEATVRPILRNLLQNVFRGRVSHVMQHLLAEDGVSDADLHEIRRLIDERKDQNADSKS